MTDVDLLEIRKSYGKASALVQQAANTLWSSEPDLLRAEHALREALQIIETLKGGSQ